MASCGSCGKSHYQNDYLCTACREKHDGSDHPWVGKTITSVAVREGMAGTVIYFDDNTALNLLYTGAMEG